MLYWQGKTWLKIISVTLVMAFIAYDLAWATDFSPISRKEYVSDPKPLSELLIGFNNKLRPPMGFADKGSIRHLDDKALTDLETSGIGNTPAAALSDRVGAALDALKAPVAQPVEHKVTPVAKKTNGAKKVWITTLLLLPLAAFGIIGGIGGPGLKYRESREQAGTEARFLERQLEEQEKTRHEINGLNIFRIGIILARIILIPLLPYLAVQFIEDTDFVESFIAIVSTVILEISIIVFSKRALINIKEDKKALETKWKGAEWSTINRLKIGLDLAESGDSSRETKGVVMGVMQTVDINGSKRFAVALRGVISEKIDELMQKLKDKESALNKYGVNVEYVRKNIWMLFDISQKAILALAQRIGVTPETAAQFTRTAGFEMARGTDRASAWRSIGKNQFHQDLKTSKLSEGFIEQQDITAVLSAGQAIKQALSTLLPAIRGSLLVLSLDIANRVEPARRNSLKARLVGRIDTAYNPPVVVQKGQSIAQVVVDYLIRKELGIAADLFKKLPDSKKAREEVIMAADNKKMSDYSGLIYAISQLPEEERAAVIKVVNLFVGLKLRAEVAHGVEAEIMQIIRRGGSVVFDMPNSDKAFEQMSLEGIKLGTWDDLDVLLLGARELYGILLSMRAYNRQDVLEEAVWALENYLKQGFVGRLSLAEHNLLVIEGLKRCVGDVDSLIIKAEVINSFIGAYGDVNNYAAHYERQSPGFGVLAVKAIVDVASALDKLASLGVKFIKPENIYEFFKLIKKMDELAKGLPVVNPSITAPLEVVFAYAENLCGHLPRQIAMVISQMTYEDNFMNRQSSDDKKLVKYVSGVRILWVIAKGIGLITSDKHSEDAVYLIRNVIGLQAESIESTAIMLNNMSPSAIGKIILSDKKITKETRFGEDLLRLDWISFDIFKGVIDWLISKGETEYAQAILDTVGKDALGNNIKAYLATFNDPKKQAKIAQGIGKSFAKWPNREVVLGAIGFLDTELASQIDISMYKNMNARQISIPGIFSRSALLSLMLLLGIVPVARASNAADEANLYGFVGFGILVLIILAFILAKDWDNKDLKKIKESTPKGTRIEGNTGARFIIILIGIVAVFALGSVIIGPLIAFLSSALPVIAIAVVAFLLLSALLGGGGSKKESESEPAPKPEPESKEESGSSGNWATTAGWFIVIGGLILAALAVLGVLGGEIGSPAPIPVEFSYNNITQNLGVFPFGLLGLTASTAIFKPSIVLPQHEEVSRIKAPVEDSNQAIRLFRRVLPYSFGSDEMTQEAENIGEYLMQHKDGLSGEAPMDLSQPTFERYLGTIVIGNRIYQIVRASYNLNKEDMYIYLLFDRQADAYKTKPLMHFYWSVDAERKPSLLYFSIADDQLTDGFEKLRLSGVMLLILLQDMERLSNLSECILTCPASFTTSTPSLIGFVEKLGMEALNRDEVIKIVEKSAMDDISIHEVGEKAYFDIRTQSGNIKVFPRHSLTKLECDNILAIGAPLAIQQIADMIREGRALVGGFAVTYGWSSHKEENIAALREFLSTLPVNPWIIEQGDKASSVAERKDVEPLDQVTGKADLPAESTLILNAAHRNEL